MPRKRVQRFNLTAPRDTPIAVHLYGAGPSTPASAVADRIFNDPESWKADTRLGLSKDDVAAWDLLDQFPAVPSGPDSADFTLKPFTNRFKLSVRPDLASPESELESDTETLCAWEGVKDKNTPEAVPFITFSRAASTDKVANLDHMSVLLSHSNIFRAFPSPLTPAPASASPSPDVTLGLFRTPASTPCSAFVPLHSPLRSESSKSTTWSILEYYGATTPETPRSAALATVAVTASGAPASSVPTPPRLPNVPAAPSAPPPPVPSVPVKAPPASARAPPRTPTSRQGARSGSIRPLPPIPLDAPSASVPPLAPPKSWSRPRATTISVLRRLPPPPPPPKDTTRQHATLSLI
ncbi:hypothetical protein GGX14DRAFT_467572 [Mycena pura]|uniref:Uncharacterized protein n=1 Tax=Mycena pura TaxID=153505 RepID=A0AAD6V396_9AGAR|nr:hypothetical protein GGX14DRAFT_467572 [Mycena pura]